MQPIHDAVLMFKNMSKLLQYPNLNLRLKPGIGSSNFGGFKLDRLGSTRVKKQLEGLKFRGQIELVYQQSIFELYVLVTYVT